MWTATNTYRSPLDETTDSNLRGGLLYRTLTQMYCYSPKNSLRKAKAFSSRILFFLIFSMSAEAGGWYRPLLCLTICGSSCPPAENSFLNPEEFNSKSKEPERCTFMIFYLDFCHFLQPPYADNLPRPPSLLRVQRRLQETPPVVRGQPVSRRLEDLFEFECKVLYIILPLVAEWQGYFGKRRQPLISTSL